MKKRVAPGKPKTFLPHEVDVVLPGVIRIQCGADVFSRRVKPELQRTSMGMLVNAGLFRTGLKEDPKSTGWDVLFIHFAPERLAPELLAPVFQAVYQGVSDVLGSSLAHEPAYRQILCRHYGFVVYLCMIDDRPEVSPAAQAALTAGLKSAREQPTVKRGFVKEKP